MITIVVRTVSEAALCASLLADRSTTARILVGFSSADDAPAQAPHKALPQQQLAQPAAQRPVATVSMALRAQCDAAAEQQPLCVLTAPRVARDRCPPCGRRADRDTKHARLSVLTSNGYPHNLVWLGCVGFGLFSANVQ